MISTSVKLNQATSKNLSQGIREKVHTYFYPTRIDFPLNLREQVVELLNQSLATNADLKLQTKQAHWNTKGTDFYQLHLLFDEIASELEEYTDLIAERITTLAGTAMGTARIAASHSLLPEYPFEVVEGTGHVRALAERFSIYAQHLRTAIEMTDELND
jgi:starvation-inducible DNA-binding protein